MNPDAPRLNLPEDYVRDLQCLANRYGTTYGVFYAGGNYRLEAVHKGRRRAYAFTLGPNQPFVPPPDDPRDHWCSAEVKQKGRRNVFGLCKLPAHQKASDSEDWLCLVHSSGLGNLPGKQVAST